MSTWIIPESITRPCPQCRAVTFPMTAPPAARSANPPTVVWLDVDSDSTGLYVIHASSAPDGTTVFRGGTVTARQATAMRALGYQTFTEHKATCRKRGGSRKREW